QREGGKERHVGRGRGGNKVPTRGRAEEAPPPPPLQPPRRREATALAVSVKPGDGGGGRSLLRVTSSVLAVAAARRIRPHLPPARRDPAARWRGKPGASRVTPVARLVLVVAWRQAGPLSAAGRRLRRHRRTRGPRRGCA